jgi:ABC-type Zn uptake system ZnuABC Zn-binding protein ZnuA
MRLKSAFALIFIAALAACANPSPPKADTRIAVLTTISTLNSFVEAVGGNRVRVDNLVPVGVSPENYQPTPQDVARVSDAQILVENGAGLETWLGRTLANASSPNLRTVVGSDGLPIKIGNPHLWMDPVYAKTYVTKIRDALISVDPKHGYFYTLNARRYLTKLDVLTKYIRKQIATIPPQRRTMIVFHNAWAYYNERFGIRTVGVIETNPGQDPNPQQIAHLIDLAKTYDVRAVFAEPEYSPKLAQALAQSAGIKVVANLYDDSIGQDPRVRDYVSMLRYDTDTIVKALQ